VAGDVPFLKLIVWALTLARLWHSYILKDFVSGKLLFCKSPPGYQQLVSKAPGVAEEVLAAFHENRSVDSSWLSGPRVCCSAVTCAALQLPRGCHTWLCTQRNISPCVTYVHENALPNRPSNVPSHCPILGFLCTVDATCRTFAAQPYLCQRGGR